MGEAYNRCGVFCQEKTTHAKNAKRLRMGRRWATIPVAVHAGPTVERGLTGNAQLWFFERPLRCDMLKFCCLFVFLLVTACEGSPYVGVSDEELHAKAKTLPLSQRYDLYVEVLHSQIPSRPVLSEDVAALGSPAWEYVLHRALTGDDTELLNALPVLSDFQRRCSVGEISQLRAHIDNVAGDDTAEALRNSINDLCGAELPTAD